MGEVVERLGIDARHVIFGHTHRAGPAARRRRRRVARCRAAAQLINTGCWVYESMYLDRHWGSPYWPGPAVELESGGEPRLVRLLEGIDAGGAQAPGSTTPGVKQVA